MINFLQSFIAIFPDTIEPFIRIAFYVFIIFAIVNIVLTAVWVINQLKRLFGL